MKVKKKSFLIIGFLIAVILNGFSSESIYRLRMNFYARSWGKLILIIPYRAYAEVGADLILKVKKKKEGYYYYFNDIGSPVYYVQTIDFIPKEIHARVGAKSIREGVSFGKKKLNTICSHDPIFCKGIPISKKKALPFLFRELKDDNFEFVRLKNGKIPKESVKNRIKLYYAWPARSKFGIPSYDMLKASLCFFNIRYKEYNDTNKKKYRVMNINLNECLNRVLYYAVPAVKRFLHLRQKRLFHQYYIREEKNGRIFLKGEAYPDVKVWGKYKIKYFNREMIINSKTGEFVYDIIRLKVSDEIGRGGEGVIELLKVK